MDKYFKLIAGLYDKVFEGKMTEEDAILLANYAYEKYVETDTELDEDEVYSEAILSSDYRRANMNGLMKSKSIVLKKEIKDKLSGNKPGSKKEIKPSPMKDAKKILVDMHKKAAKVIEQTNHIYKCDDKTHEKLVALEAIMRAELNLKKYQKAYREFTRTIGIPSEHIDIRYIRWKKLENGDWQCSLEYRYNKSPIRLPEGLTLYHVTTRDNLKYLYPTFKGKRIGEDKAPHMNGTGELYSSPRVYFSIRKTILPGVAGLKTSKTNSATYLYEAVDNLNGRVYVDKATAPFINGAVYVESDEPIRVKRVYE